MRLLRTLPGWFILLALISGHILAAQKKGQDKEKPQEKQKEATSDEQTLKGVHVAHTGPGLLEFFRKRATTELDATLAKGLIDKLNDATAATRDAAFGDLVSFGAAAVPALRQASNNLDDLEASGRARKCLQAIEGEPGRSLTRTAARLLAERKPAGAAEVLLTYLPFAEDESVLEDIETALGEVAVRDGKPDPAILKALEDKNATRRAAAADLLCKLDATEHFAAIHPLLKDSKQNVRLRVALGLANSFDGDAIPVLIQLLSELPAEKRAAVEEYLNTLAGEWAVSAPKGETLLARKLRREVWTAWWKAASGDALLDEFRKRSLSDADRERASALIPKLADSDATVRDKAAADLLALGAAVAPLLRQAAASGDPKISAPAASYLQLIEKETPSALPQPAIRLLALRKPEGAAKAVLDFLPAVEGEAALDELQSALNAVAVRDGKADPAAVKALEHKLAAIRAAAAEALCHGGLKDQAEAVRRVLKDKEPSVRLRVALALAHAQDKQAVPALIELLGELPQEQGWRVESCLVKLAGDKAPKAPLGADKAAREKCRDAWAAWWKENDAKVDMAVLKRAPVREAYLGYTVIAMNNNARVCELGRDGKERWAIGGLNNPWDVQALPGDKVLIAEFNGAAVTERNLKGEVLWRKQCQNPIACQRLRNGNTFIVTRQQLMEVNRDGKELMTINRNWDIMGAKKLRNGQIIMFSNNGTAIFFDASGKETKSISVGNGGVQWGGGDVTEEGHVIVPQWQFNKVVEYDRDGKEVWSAQFQWPNTCQRLPNGNTLVASQNSNKIAEINRAGKVVWEHQTNNGQPFRVHGH
jgi:HEAT repeat protein